MYIQGQQAVRVPRQDLRPSHEVRLQGRDSHLEGRPVRPRPPDAALQEGRGEVLLQHGRASRRFRPVEVRAPAALERRGDGAEEGHRRAVQEGRREAGAAVRRERAPGAQLSLVLHFAHQRQDRPAGRRALRRRRPRLRRPLSRTADGLSLRPADYTTARRRIPGSSTTSSASRIWSTTTSPTCSTPTATSSSRNTAWPW